MMTEPAADAPGAPAPADLSHAGAIVDKAIEYMVSQNISSIAIASALLGGSLGLLARSVDDASIEGILGSALASVRSGELRRGVPDGNGSQGPGGN